MHFHSQLDSATSAVYLADVTWFGDDGVARAGISQSSYNSSYPHFTMYHEI